MTENPSVKPIYLCAGMQSGGTTLVSWCFLQRPDMDGMLDMPHCRIQDVPVSKAPIAWCKMTVCSFRWPEVAAVFRQWGWEDVRPLLVVRDVRHVMASLRLKNYGMNGTTAEDPPLRVRFLRFLEDWRLFRANQWPILRYESLVEQPEATLRAACGAMGLPWHDEMIAFSGSKEDASLGSGNRSFHESLSYDGLDATLQRYRQSVFQRQAPGLPAEEVSWLDETFAAYNQVHGYNEDGCSFTDPDALPFYPTYMDQLRREKWVKSAKNIQRLKKHPVFGRLIQAWRRFINPDFDIFPKS